MRRCDVNVNSVDIRRSSMTTATATRRRRQKRARENCRLNTYDIGMAWHFVVTMAQNISMNREMLYRIHALIHQLPNRISCAHFLLLFRFAIVFDADGFVIAIFSLCPLSLSHSLALSTFLFVLLVFEPLSSVLMLWHCFDALVYECVCECVYYERSATAIRSHFLSFVRWAHISKEFNHLRVCMFVRVWIFDIWPQ